MSCCGDRSTPLSAIVAVVTGQTVDSECLASREAACQDCSARFGPVCTLCGCLLDLKRADPRGACPAGRWSC